MIEGRAGEDLQLSCEPDVDPAPPLLFQWRLAGRIIEPQNIENPARLIIPLTRELNGVVMECRTFWLFIPAIKPLIHHG